MSRTAWIATYAAIAWGVFIICMMCQMSDERTSTTHANPLRETKK